MSNFVTPEMALTIPDLNTSGPGYATIVNNDLVIVAAHDHDGSQYGGSLININGQIISGDLSLDGYNLSNVRSTQFINEPSVLVGSQDVNNIYVSNGNLYYNNADGIAVEITAGNTLAPATNGPTTNWSIRNITSNATILYTDTYNCLDVDTTGGNIIIVLPRAALIVPSPIGRIYLFRTINNSSINTLTIQAAIGSGDVFADTGLTTFVIDNPGGYVAIYTDGSSKWFTWSQNIYNGESLYLNNSSYLSLDGSSHLVGNTGSTVLLSGNTMTINGGGELLITNALVSFNENADVSWVGNATETYAVGTTSSFQIGSTLNIQTGSTIYLNGILSGTSSSSGDWTSAGQVNFTGQTTFSGTGAVLNGSLNVNLGSIILELGLINATNNSNITLDNTSTLTNHGMTNLFGTTNSFASVNYGGSGITTYTCDLLSGLDYIVRFTIIATCAFRLTLPANPAKGRTIILSITDTVNGFAADNWSVVVNGNGKNVFVPDNGTTAATWTLNNTYFSNAYPSKNSDWSGSITWIYDGNDWIALSVVL